MGTSKLFDAVRIAASKPGPKPAIAIGATKYHHNLRESLLEGSRYADLIVVGININIDGIRCVRVSGGEDKIAEN